MDALRDYADTEIKSRISDFESSLARLTSQAMVHRFVLNGGCYALNHSQHMQLKEQIADHFGIPSMEIVVVGSAKLGFSIAPYKRFRPFDDDSDIDVAIASPSLFDRIWSECLNYYRTDAAAWRLVSDFQDYLFKGWIRPDKMPDTGLLSLADEWWEFFRSLTASGDYGRIKVAGALYRSWTYLEYYQFTAVERCRKDDLEERL